MSWVFWVNNIFLNTGVSLKTVNEIGGGVGVEML